ncbi:MAG: universal stress protein [Nitrospinota bacterium]
MKVDRILAATDFSPDSRYSLRWAASLAKAFDAELILQHVVSNREAEALVFKSGQTWQTVPEEEGDRVESLPRGEVSAGELWETVIRQASDKAESLLQEALSAEELKDLKTRKILSVGKPHEEIVRAAREEGADLIVMGTHGRHGLSHLLMGSVAERVVRIAPVPVFTVRHPDKPFGEK